MLSCGKNRSMTFTLHSQARPLGLSVWRTLPCLRSGAPSLRSRLSLALPKPACRYEQSTGRAHACFAARRDSPPAEADSRRADIEREVEVVAAERDPRSDVHPAQKLFANLLKGFAVAALVVGLVRTMLHTYPLVHVVHPCCMTGPKQPVRQGVMHRYAAPSLALLLKPLSCTADVVVKLVILLPNLRG